MKNDFQRKHVHGVLMANLDKKELSESESDAEQNERNSWIQESQARSQRISAEMDQELRDEEQKSQPTHVHGVPLKRRSKISFKANVMCDVTAR